MKTQEQKDKITAKSTKELSNLYGVSRRVFNRWLRPFKKEIGERQGHYYTVAQVKIILDRLGPYNLMTIFLTCLLWSLSRHC